MTTKRTQYRVGPFMRTALNGKLVDANGNSTEQPGDIDTLAEALQEATPRGRVKRWRPHAERLNVAGDLLNEAESLIDDQGNVENMDRFTLLMAQIEITIERAQNEALDIYGKVGRQARHIEKLCGNVSEYNEQRRDQAETHNAWLIEIDDRIAKEWPHLSQEQRARKIINEHDLDIKASSLAKRIRSARK